MDDNKELMPGKEAAEDYRRQRQAADHGRDGFAEEVRARFEDHRRNDRGKILELARSLGLSEERASKLTDELLAEVTTEAISPIDEPYGHRIIRGLVDEINAICERGEVPIREGVVIGVSPTDGLHAYQSEVPATGASIIDFAVPFITFCNQFAILMARTLPHERDGARLAVSCDPARIPEVLGADRLLLQAWVLLLARYAIEGWPTELPRTDEDAARLQTRVQMLHAMELFAVAHEYGHHVLLHGLSDSSSPEGDPTMMEHDADGFARMASMAIGTSAEPPNPFEVSGSGGVLMLGALDLVRRTIHVLSAGNTDFPPRDVHPPLHERIEHIGHFDRFAPEDVREQLATMRSDLLGVVEQIWKPLEGIFLKMHHEGGVHLPAADRAGVGWISLI